jgi:hypothetical protein
MNITDELLMAYADGEVDAATREQIERAISTDPALRAKVERHRALRTQLSAAFDPVLSEAVPERFNALLSSAKAADVADLSQARAARQERKAIFFQQPTAWMSLAASVVVGVAIGFLAFGDRNSEMIVAHADGLAASGELERALANTLAADSTRSATVQIGLSYRSKSGEYCRSFAVTEGSYAGFACRSVDEWRIRMLVPARASETGDFRTASTALPESVLAAIGDDMHGEALDAEEEARAREQGWK